MDGKALEKLVSSKPPRCLRRLEVKRTPMPAAWGRGVATRFDAAAAWKLACSCLNDKGSLLGFPLAALNPKVKRDKSFVSPLSFRCSRCSATTSLLDTDKDGAGAELAKLEKSEIGSATLRGSGKKLPYPCPKCRCIRGEGAIAFFYTADYTEELEEDGIALPFENLFSGVRVYYRCGSCGKQSLAVDLDTKY